MCVLNFSTFFPWNIDFSENNSVRYYRNCTDCTFSSKWLAFFSEFSHAWIFDRFSKSLIIYIYYISRKFDQLKPSSSMLTERRTDTVTKLIVAVLRLSNASKERYNEQITGKLPTICSPTIHLHKPVFFADCYIRKNCVELTAVTCSASSVVCTMKLLIMGAWLA
jgi:hypothetical protein